VPVTLLPRVGCNTAATPVPEEAGADVRGTAHPISQAAHMVMKTGRKFMFGSEMSREP
jgi:hypothetical protein